MADRARYAALAAATPVALFALALVAAPSFMAPVFDKAVAIGGFPAGVVILAVSWAILLALGLMAIWSARRVKVWLGAVVAIAVLSVLVLLLTPLAVSVITSVPA